MEGWKRRKQSGENSILKVLAKAEESKKVNDVTHCGIYHAWPDGEPSSIGCLGKLSVESAYCWQTHVASRLDRADR